jgi:choline-sulfatase
LESIQLPPYLENDLEDCGRFITKMKAKSPWYTRLERLREAYGGEQGWKRWIQGYLASVAFVDEQLGTVLDALDKSPHAANTVVVFTSDHGFHMGEKDLLLKKTVWEESTRVPLVIRAPGVGRPGGQCDHPVSLVDLYPTLIDLCGLGADPNRDGNGERLNGCSMRPFLIDPVDGRWEGPAVALSVIEGGDAVEIGEIAPVARQHFTVRSRHWRYCLWNNGEEELYDHRTDPHEWHNLAARPEHTQIKQQLRQQLLQARKTRE